MSTLLRSDPTARAGATRSRRAPALLALIAMLVISPMLLLSGVFQDEGATLYSAGLSLGDLLAQARVQDVGYVPYYLLMHVWLLPTDALVWARLPSLLGLGAAVYLVTRAAQVWLGSPRWALLAGAVTALDPVLVGQASNTRPYALTAAAAALALYGLARLDRDVAGGEAMFVVGATAAVLLHEFAVLGPLTALLVVGLARRWSRRRLVRLAAAPSVLLLLLAAMSSQQRGQLSFLEPLGVHDAAVLLFAPAGLTPFLGLPQVVTVLLLGVLAGRQLLDVRLLAPAAAVVVPSALLVLISLVTPVYLVRYVTASAPALGLLVAIALQTCWRTVPLRRGIAAGLGAVLLLLDAGVLLRSFVTPLDFQVTEAARACARSATVALPTHMAETTLKIEVPSGSRAWPGVPQPYLERLALDTSPAAFADAGDTVAVCDYIHSAQDAKFEQQLQQRGWRLVRSQDFDEWFVHSYAR